MLAAAVLLSVLVAQELPHAFPRVGARKVFEDQYVVAWDANWELHKPTPLHRHGFDYVGVDLVDAKVLVTPPGGVGKEYLLKRGGIFVLSKGTTHVEEGISEPGRHAVILDLKDVTGQFGPACSSSGSYFNENNSKRLAENERIVVWEHTWPSRAAKDNGIGCQETPTYLLIVDGGELTTVPGMIDVQRKRKVVAGEVVAMRFGIYFPEYSTEGSVRAIVVELKR